METVEALLEIEAEVPDALSTFALAGQSMTTGIEQVERLLPDVSGIAFRQTAKPIPMFTPGAGSAPAPDALGALAAHEPSRDLASVTQVIPVQLEPRALEKLREHPGVKVWPSSPIAFEAIDCAPFRDGVAIAEIRRRLGIDEDGPRGAGVAVAVLDQGIDGTTYRIAGGYARDGAQAPGTAPVHSHGSMVAADVLVAAPDAALYDYPFMVPRSGGALVMLNAVLEQRRRDGTPQIVSNSWGFNAVPAREAEPGHEIWDLDHPLHRKIREVVSSGAIVLFAAGNCGEECPSGGCHVSSIGPGRSIHGPNSLAEVITVAAVNSAGERVGYSSQGPGLFEPEKPDVASYTHFFGNFGDGRPAGPVQPFDNGTSAACPVAAGVVALLVEHRPALTPGGARAALVAGAGDRPWDPGVGHGVVHAGRSLAHLDGAP